MLFGYILCHVLVCYIVLVLAAVLDLGLVLVLVVLVAVLLLVLVVVLVVLVLVVVLVLFVAVVAAVVVVCLSDRLQEVAVVSEFVFDHLRGVRLGMCERKNGAFWSRRGLTLYFLRITIWFFIFVFPEDGLVFLT